MNLIEVVKTRYATKKFDASKKINDADFDKIKTLLRYSPSSINSQPWHFIIAQTVAAKLRFSQAAQDKYKANEPKILDASHVILFCAKTKIDQTYLEKITEQESLDGRFTSPESKEQALKVREFYLGLHTKEFDDLACWSQNQVYMNWGTVLLGAGILNIDAVPIEGVDLAVLNEDFNLSSRGLKAVGMVALGYRSEADFNANLPKSRLPEEDIFTILD